VQAVNSLRGAALVQAVMFINRIRAMFPEVPVTESHPKALLRALYAGGWDQFAARYRLPLNMVNDHERDALMGAIAAREGFTGRWPRDLSLVRHPSEQVPSEYWLAPVHYFWPE